MTATPRKYWLAAVVALVGIAFVGTGLWLALLSNPNRFSLHIADDSNIHLLAISGFGCTIVGLGLFLAAARHTTKSMPKQLRMNANVGAGIGIVLQLAGLYMHDGSLVTGLSGLLLILASLPAFIWGAMNYALGKGHSRWVGLLGAGGVLGLVILILLPPTLNRDEIHNSQTNPENLATAAYRGH